MIFPVVIATGFHLFPFRTEKLSPTAPMVLHTRGRVGRRHFTKALSSIWTRGFFVFLHLLFFIPYPLFLFCIISVIAQRDIYPRVTVFLCWSCEIIIVCGCSRRAGLGLSQVLRLQPYIPCSSLKHLSSSSTCFLWAFLLISSVIACHFSPLFLLKAWTSCCFLKITQDFFVRFFLFIYICAVMWISLV